MSQSPEDKIVIKENLIISKQNQYIVGDEQLFYILLNEKRGTTTYRDIYKVISKNFRPDLIVLAKNKYKWI